MRTRTMINPSPMMRNGNPTVNGLTAPWLIDPTLKLQPPLDGTGVGEGVGEGSGAAVGVGAVVGVATKVPVGVGTRVTDPGSVNGGMVGTAEEVVGVGLGTGVAARPKL